MVFISSISPSIITLQEVSHFPNISWLKVNCALMQWSVGVLNPVGQALFDFGVM